MKTRIIVGANLQSYPQPDYIRRVARDTAGTEVWEAVWEDLEEDPSPPTVAEYMATHPELHQVP